MKAWLLLIIAGLMEMGWPLGLKLSSIYTKYSVPLLIAAGLCMAVSVALLYLAQKSIPISTAYVVWTGVGAVGTFLLGILLFGDSVNTMKCVSAILIIAGVIGLKVF